MRQSVVVQNVRLTDVLISRDGQRFAVRKIERSRGESVRITFGDHVMTFPWGTGVTREAADDRP